MKDTVAVLKSIADEKRLRIIKMLEHKSMCVCEMAKVLGVSQPAVSKHVKKLMDAGLVISEKNGFWTDYCLKVSSNKVRSLLRKVTVLIEDDDLVLEDRKKAQHADRRNICSSK